MGSCLLGALQTSASRLIEFTACQTHKLELFASFLMEKNELNEQKRAKKMISESQKLMTEYSDEL